MAQTYSSASGGLPRYSKFLMRRYAAVLGLLLLAGPSALAADGPPVALKRLQLTFTGKARGLLGETLYLTLRTYRQPERIAVAQTAIDLRGKALLDLPENVPDDQLESPDLETMFPIGKSCHETGLSRVTAGLTLATGGGFASSSRTSDTGFVDMDFAHEHTDPLGDTSHFLIYASQDGMVELRAECSDMQSASGEGNGVSSSFWAKLTVFKGWNVMQGHFQFQDGKALITMTSVLQQAELLSDTLEVTKTKVTTVVLR